MVGNSEIDLPPFFEFKKHDSSTRKEPLSRDPSTALFRAGFDGQPVVDWNDHHGKWCSSVVAHLREQTPKLIAADHRVFVIRAENHHMWVPMTDSRSKILIRGPHVRKADAVSSRKFSFDVGRLKTLGNLIRRLPRNRKLGSQFVIGHHHARCWCGEADRCPDGWVVDDLAELRGRVGRCREPAHDHAHRAVIAILSDLETGRRQDLYRRVAGNTVRRRALRQRDFGVSCHHVLAERRGFRPFCILTDPPPAGPHGRQYQSISFLFPTNFPSYVYLTS